MSFTALQSLRQTQLSSQSMKAAVLLGAVFLPKCKHSQWGRQDESEAVFFMLRILIVYKMLSYRSQYTLNTQIHRAEQVLFSALIKQWFLM